MTKLVMADTRSENAEMDIGRLNVRIDKVVVVVMVMVMMVTMMVVMFNIVSHVPTCRWRRTLWWRSQRSSKFQTTSMPSLKISCEMAWILLTDLKCLISLDTAHVTAKTASRINSGKILLRGKAGLIIIDLAVGKLNLLLKCAVPPS